jgi:hypothetical protein
MSSQPSAVRVKPKTKLCYGYGPENPRGLQVPSLQMGLMATWLYTPRVANIAAGRECYTVELLLR